MTTVEEVRERQRMIWSEAASGWERWADWDDVAFRAPTAWTLRATGAAPGGRILDIGCGAGLPSLALADAVGPAGHVLATDLVPAMLAVVERRARGRGLGQLATRMLDIGTDAPPDAAFDAVTCSFGLMFAPDLPRAVRTMRTALVPGGRVAVVTWDALERNPFLATAIGVVSRWLPAPPPGPDAPHPFRLADPGALETLLAAAGFREIAVEPIEFEIGCASPDEYWAAMLDHASGMRLAIERLPAADAAALGAEVRAAAARMADGDRLRFPARAWGARGIA